MATSSDRRIFTAAKEEVRSSPKSDKYLEGRGQGVDEFVKQEQDCPKTFFLVNSVYTNNVPWAPGDTTSKVSCCVEPS